MQQMHSFLLFCCCEEKLKHLTGMALSHSDVLFPKQSWRWHGGPDKLHTLCIPQYFSCDTLPEPNKILTIHCCLLFRWQNLKKCTCIINWDVKIHTRKQVFNHFITMRNKQKFQWIKTYISVDIDLKILSQHFRRKSIGSLWQKINTR